MNDIRLNKAYTVKELGDMLFSDYKMLLDYIVNTYLQFSASEQRILDAYEKLQDRPYAYARNPLSFVIGKENEAESVEFSNYMLEAHAKKIMYQKLEKMPKNIRITYINMNKRQKSFVNSVYK